MDFERLAAFFERLEGTTKRLELASILVEALEAAEPDEVGALSLLLQGRVAPDWEGIEIGLAEKQILIVLADAAGLDRKKGGVADATKVYHEAGDLGLAAQRLLEQRGGARQVGLMAFGAPEPAAALSVVEVHARLVEIATVAGQGSQERKQEMLRKLLADCPPLAARYIVRMVAGRLRLGVADMTFLDALAAWHLRRGVRSVQGMPPEERAEHEDVRARLERAYDLRSDLALVAPTLAQGGMEAVDLLDVQTGTPLRPMAAERMKTLPEILEKQATDDGLAMDYKYDGLRIQAHVGRDGTVRLFSRRLEDLTQQFPDVVANLQAAFPDQDLIVEGEAVALGKEGRMLPFQEVSRRRGRKTGLGGADVTTLSGTLGASAAYDITKEIPITLALFDVLAIGGKPTLAWPFERRRAALEALLEDAPQGIRPSTYMVAQDAAEMEMFFQAAVADGAEGIMCKQLDAPYKAGSRGYAWIKFKTDYTEDLVDTMDLVAIGAFVGRGRRAGWYGALLCAAYDPDTDAFRSVCKLGTGFDDATLMGLKELFAPHVAPDRPARVDSEMAADAWFEPALVMEVQAAELTLSPIHRAAWGRLRDGAGLAARFPRFTRWRDDKKPEQATTVDELVTMYRQQGKQA